MVTRVAAVLLGLLALVCWDERCLAQGGTAAVDPSDALRLEVVVEAPAGSEPIEQEMMLLSVRGTYDARLNIALDTLAQPELQRFSWTQLGRDRWGRGLVDGRQVRTFERRLAVFPQRPGNLRIGSFTHTLTLVTGDGGRVPHEVRSAPVTVDVQAKPAATGWWLPARDIRVSDEWDRAPDQLVPGDLAQRTVTLEAVGVTAQFLPPAPEMAGTGLIVFTDPEERSSRITPDGPISRVRWRWTVRPASSSPAELRPVTIPWFDTGTRQLRELALAPQKVGFAGQAAMTSSERFLQFGPWMDHAAPAGWAVGLVGGLLILLRGGRLKPAPTLQARLQRLLSLNWLLSGPELRELRRATRQGDMMAVRQAAHRWVQRLGEQGHAVNPSVAALLRDLDRHLFGRGRETGTRISQDLARELLRAVRQQSRARATWQAARDT